MRPARRGIAVVIVACVVAIVVLAAAFGLYFVSSDSSIASLGSQVSSLSTASSEASEIVVGQSSLIVAQQSTISCLQSEVESLQSSSSETGSASTAVGSCTTQNEPLRMVNITGTLSVPTGAQEGLLSVNVWNGAGLLITGISLNATRAGLSTEYGPPVFRYNGMPISVLNPLPEGMTAMGNATLLSGASGLYATYGYDFQVTVTFQDGISQSQTLYIRAAV